MKRMNLTPAEIAKDERFRDALEYADAYLDEYTYLPVIFTITRKGKLQWRSVDDAGRVVRQFNWHAHVRVWVRSTFAWSYKERAVTPAPVVYAQPGPIQPGDMVFVHPDGRVRRCPPAEAGALVIPMGVALGASTAGGTVEVLLGSPMAGGTTMRITMPGGE
jgi:hypothetical protein